MSDETTKRLLGTWKLVSAQIHDLETGGKTNIMGPRANGFINYGADGRMIVLVVGGPRARPAGAAPSPDEKQALYDTMNAYAGTFTVTDEAILHHVDTSWNELWTGDELKRLYKFEGERRLQLAGPPLRNGAGRTVQRVMTWERIAASAAPL